MQNKLFLLTLAALLHPTLRAESNVAIFSEPVDCLNYHLRLAADGARPRTATMVWNYADSANYTAISYTIAPRTADDPQLGFDSDYRIHRLCSGRDSTLATGRFTTSYPTGATVAMSAVLSVEGGHAFVSLGGTRADITVEVPFDVMQPDGIGYLCSKAAKELRNDIRWQALPRPEASPILDMAGLKERIESSTDAMETFWRYLDRDTDPAKASLGDSYTLATIVEADGSYTIINVDKLAVKGRLHPTIFAGHYDLEWYDAQGHKLSTETSATTELDGTVLRLNFPLHAATIRFARARLR